MFHSLGQEWAYVAYDEAIYSKVEMIKWRNPAEFCNDELEMGGMHRTMNFMGDIGHILEDSGFEDIIVEASIYGSSIVGHIMKGKSYNRGLRLHKLMNEALNRVKWLTLVKQLSQRDSGLEDKVLHEIADSAKACLN